MFFRHKASSDSVGDLGEIRALIKKGASLRPYISLPDPEGINGRRPVYFTWFQEHRRKL